MSDLRKLSELPEDPNYWAGLEARILADTDARKKNQRNGPVWWLPLAKRATGLGWLAAAGLAALILGSRSNAQPASPPGLLHWPNEDPRAAAFLSSPSPPPLASLVLSSELSGSE
jgi:hypothetical protein